MIDHLRDGLRIERQLVFRAIRRAGAGKQQAQVVVDFGDGADGRARVVAGGLLLDRDRRGKALDQIDIGFVHALQELPGVGRERFDVTPLALRVERVEGERGLAGAGQPGDDDHPVAWQIEVDVFQVVRACAANSDVLMFIHVVRFDSVWAGPEGSGEPANIRKCVVEDECE